MSESDIRTVRQNIDVGSQVRVPPLIKSWFESDLEGEKLFSQTQTSVTILVGHAVLQSIASKEATWAYFVASNFSEDQIVDLEREVTVLHRAFGVDKIPDKHRDESRGEKHFDSSKIRTNYERVKDNIASALYALSVGDDSGERVVYPIREIQEQVGAFLENPANMVMARDLFEAAAQAITSTWGREIAGQHRRKFRFKTKKEASRPITSEETASLRHALNDDDSVLFTQLQMVGNRYGMKAEVIRTFMYQLQGTIFPSVRKPTPLV